jgi:hypothetical protein
LWVSQVLFLNECLFLYFISSSIQSGNFWIQARTPAMLYSPEEIKKVEVGVTSSGIKFIQNSVKIGRPT